MRKLFAAVALLCSFLGGYCWGLQHDAEELRQLATDLSSGDSGIPSSSLGYAISVLTEGPLSTSNPLQAHPVGPASVVSAIDHATLSSHEEDLWKAIGDDSVGNQFRRVLVASRHSPEIPGTDLYLRSFYQNLGENHLEEIHQVLKRIPQEGFPMERAALLMMMRDSAKNNSLTKAQALSELVENPVPPRPDPTKAQTEEELNAALSTTPATALPIVAQAVFLDQVTDPKEALGGTIQGIVAQPDQGIRFSLAMQFVERYPSLKSDLVAALDSQGVQLSLGGEQLR